MKKKAIFVDRDGTIIAEPADEQIDSLEKLAFVPGAISGLRSLMGLGYELVMASNQDGLGTDSFPESTFWPAHDLMLKTLEGEGVYFDGKPGTGMFGKYLSDDYDMSASFVIGDRETDMELARNLGATPIIISKEHGWGEAVERIRSTERCAVIARKTSETDIYVRLDLDGRGPSEIDTGLKFLDHMLTLFAAHSGYDLSLTCHGDTQVDDHHTTEDIGIALGEAFRQALGERKGIIRYGSMWLPMDEALVLCAVDISSRSHLEYRLCIPSQKVGTFDTELVEEFYTAFVRKATRRRNKKTCALRKMPGSLDFTCTECSTPSVSGGTITTGVWNSVA